ncbi:GATA zinc finger domain-containing protein 14 isoform X2 [Hyposmocoma kahamanoa]|uniref:GATA zinc finger domain-containing protein 14 isoform X2 n=1 Tax=Hyposmocoma kahamanoa TaxID=1477025 RepID=UPI000E6D646F|nr:GATA zinc finger domain-containing protein 14 isoform X2 [Hyposmocoma kahamanoa]
MSVYNSKKSTNLIQTEVRSKYFTNKTGMDESLSDFQEKKKSCCGPKTTQVAKAKPNKRIKRIKGQKDIRSILKSKKIELVAYSSDFDKICKQSGLDVDSEQLQTAIALSRSLQETENFGENTPQSSKVLSSQERIGKIRTTLQEYGFKVPEIKITETKSRKLKRSRKNYKLLLTTAIEKQQIISDRYSHVLIQNLDCIRQVESAEDVIPFCYEIATRVAYEQIRDNNIFYIEGLIKRNPNSVGSLLRDWSKIPGRPSSPKTEHSEVVFNDINCNQEELDYVLSGPLKLAQELTKNKYNVMSSGYNVNIFESNSETSQDICTQSNIMEAKVINPSKMEVEIITIDDHEHSPNTRENRQQSDIEVIDNNTPTLLVTRNTRRVECSSPDIFDDEVSTIIDNNCSNKIVVSLEIPKDSTNIDVDVMDLTECIQIGSQKNLIDSSIKEKPCFQLSQDNTKRKSNDFMELTNVVGSSQPFRQNNIEENIDLTQNSDHENELTAENKDLKQKHIEMDLTQSSDSGDDLPFVQVGGTQTSDDTVIISEETYFGAQEDPRNSSPVIDYLDNNIKTNDESDVNKELKVTPKNDTNYVRATISRNLNSLNTYNPLNEASLDSKNKVINNEVHYIITVNSSSDTVQSESIQSTESPLGEKIEDFHQSNSQRFFEEFIHPHSDEASIETENISHETPAKCNIVDKHTGNNMNIDLTQNSYNSLVLANVSDEENETPKISFENSNLGKKDNVSIDYDELLNEIVSKNSTVSFKDANASKAIVCDIFDENTGATKKYSKENKLNSSQTSEVFEISDEELDYSVHKSMLDINNPCGNFDFGGISVVDNLPDLPSIRQSRNHEQYTNKSLNQSRNNSLLPFVDRSGVTENIIKEKDLEGTLYGIEASTPFKHNLNQVLNIETPTNSEYVIKTDQVTPILNYESMTTPERNKELDKYGLKPFKRKRGK